MSESKPARKKTLGLFNLIMMLSCAILNTDLISSNTSVGTSVVFWWVAVGILYMVPTANIVTELSLAYPKQGGLYYWVTEGMNKKWGLRVSWMYWACILFLPPASFLMVADLLCSAFSPDLGYGMRVVIAIAVFWIGIFISTRPLSESKFVFNTLGMVNILVYVAIFCTGIYYIASGHAPANELNFHTMMPKLDEALSFVPIIMFCSCGIEANSQSIEDSLNPEKDIRRSMIAIILLCVGLNAAASFATLLVMPMEEMSVMSGVADIFVSIYHNRTMYILIILAIVLGIFGQICEWLITSARAVAEAAKDGDFPKIFGGETKAGLPRNAILINGVFGTLTLVIYAMVADTASSLFLSLMGCSALLSFVPYMLMVIAYLNLKKGPLANRTGYKVKAYKFQAWVLQIMQVGVTLLLIYIPGVGFTDDALMVTVGSVVTLLIGEIIINRHSNKNIQTC